MTSADSTRAKVLTALRIGPALAIVWRSGRGWAVAGAALTAAQGVLPLVSLYLLKLIVDAVAAGLDAGRGFAFAPVAWLIATAGAVALLGAALQALAGYVSEAQAETLADHMLDRLHAKSAAVDLEYYESPRYHDTLHLAQQEAPHRPRAIWNALTQIVQHGISLAAVAGLLFLCHWSVPVILVAAALPGLFVRLRYADTIFRWHRRSAPAERLSRYYTWVLTRDAHAKELRLFDLAAIFAGRFRDVRAQLRREQLGIARRRSLAELVAQGSGTAAVFATLLFIAWRTAQGAITLGDLVMYFQAFQRGLTSLRELLRGLADLYGNNLFLAAYEELLALAPRVVDPPDPRPVPRPIADGIVFAGVGFCYPESSRRALAGVDLVIRPGETVALVGENGAGKTTLVKLLCRLYEPSEGRITIDGVDLREFAAAELRREIGVVFQDFARYHLSARENVWLGDVRRPVADAAVVEAARLAGVDAAIRQLPEGYDNLLGKWFEAGEELSVGQWQKIALARAFLRRAQITVLDEPTSALDPTTEAEVIERFRELTRGRTALLISHRLSTVKMADRIYVLERGTVAESGTHAELIARHGVYARLFSSQASHYR